MESIPKSGEIVSVALALATPLKPSSIHYLVEKPSFIGDTAAWFQLMEYSNRNGTARQVARSALSADWKAFIPEASFALLHAKVEADDEIRKLVEAELDFVTQTLLKAEMSFALIKALDLARRFYPQIQDRSVDTVDLLIPQSQKLAALETLSKAGYRMFNTSRPHCTVLSRTIKGVKVNLYSSLSALDSSTIAGETWNRTEEGLIPGLPKAVRALGREDQIALLITEATLGGSPASPTLLNDLHCLIQGEKVDWDELIWMLADKRALFAGWFAFTTLYKEYLTDISEKALMSLANSINPGKRKSVEKSQLEITTAAEAVMWNDGFLDRMRFGIQHGVNPFSPQRPAK